MALHIPDTDLMSEPDLQIRRLAYSIDASLSAAVRFSVLNSTPHTTDANGRVVVTFPGLGTVAGCIVQASTASPMYGTLRTIVVPPPTIDRYLSGGRVDTIVEDRALGGGRVRVVLIVPPEYHPGTYPWGIGCQFAGGGQSVNLAGIAWGTP